MPGAATDGDFFSPPPLGEWQDIRESARNRRVASVARKPPQSPQSPIDRLPLKNTTGAQVAQGHVLQVGPSILTPWDPDNLWFEGEEPDPNGIDEIAVALNPVPEDEYDWFQGVGYCLAQVNIIQEQQQYADVDASSTLLQSKWHGRAKIVKKFSTGTGEKQCLIKLGAMREGPILCKATSGITAGSSASCDVHWAGAAASPSATITVHLKDLDGGNNLAADKFLWAWWKPDDQRYETGNAEC